MAKRAELIYLDPESILPSSHNSRKEDDLDDEAKEPTDELNFSQLCRSISQRGLLHPIGVHQLTTGEYELSYGSRRLRAWLTARPTEKIPCLLRQAEAHEAAVDNLIENLHRKGLKPWEKAEYLYELKRAFPDKPQSEIAREAGLSKQYVSSLIKMREKLHPEIWKIYKRFGHSLHIGLDTIEPITFLPKEEQLAAWNKIVEARRRVGRGKPRGSEHKPRERKLRKYLTVIPTIDEHREFKRGLRYMARVALGLEVWRYGLVPLNERARPLLKTNANKRRSAPKKA